MPLVSTVTTALELVAAGFCFGLGWAIAHWLVAKLTAPGPARN